MTIYRVLRCRCCGRQLAQTQGSYGIISIKCPRCKYINQFK